MRVPPIENNSQGRATAGEHDASVSIWRSRRPRPAPKAVRMANFFCRAAVRASSRW